MGRRRQYQRKTDTHTCAHRQQQQQQQNNTQLCAPSCAPSFVQNRIPEPFYFSKCLSRWNLYQQLLIRRKNMAQRCFGLVAEIRSSRVFSKENSRKKANKKNDSPQLWVGLILWIWNSQCFLLNNAFSLCAFCYDFSQTENPTEDRGEASER